MADVEALLNAGLSVEQIQQLHQLMQMYESMGYSPDQAQQMIGGGGNLNQATGWGYMDPKVKLILGWLSSMLGAGEMAGYVPSDLLGTSGLMPTLAREQYQTGTMFDLANLMANPRDMAQLAQLSQLAGGTPFGTAAAEGMPLTGEGFQTLIDNLLGFIPGAGGGNGSTAPSGTQGLVPAGAGTAAAAEQYPKTQGRNRIVDPEHWALGEGLPADLEAKIAAADNPAAKRAGYEHLREIVRKIASGRAGKIWGAGANKAAIEKARQAFQLRTGLPGG